MCSLAFFLHGKLFVCFTDCNSALDSIWHPGLNLKLLQKAIGGKTYDLIKSMHQPIKCRIKINRQTEASNWHKQVSQRCISIQPSSPQPIHRLHPIWPKICHKRDTSASVASPSGRQPGNILQYQSPTCQVRRNQNCNCLLGMGSLSKFQALLFSCFEKHNHGCCR